jgi:hypothetical protein
MPAKKRKEQDDLEEEEYIERKIAAAERMADSNERLANAAVEAGKHRLRMCSAIEGVGLQLYSVNQAIGRWEEGAETRDNLARRQCMAIEEGVTALVEGDQKGKPDDPFAGGDDSDDSDNNGGDDDDSDNEE